MKIRTYYDVHDFTNWQDWPVSIKAFGKLSLHDSYILYLERLENNGDIRIYLDAALHAGIPREWKDFEYLWPLVITFSSVRNESKEYSVWLDPSIKNGRSEFVEFVEASKPDIEEVMSNSLVEWPDHLTIEIQGEGYVESDLDYSVDIRWTFQCDSYEVKYRRDGKNACLAGSGTIEIIE